MDERVFNLFGRLLASCVYIKNRESATNNNRNAKPCMVSPWWVRLLCGYIAIHEWISYKHFRHCYLISNQTHYRVRLFTKPATCTWSASPGGSLTQAAQFSRGAQNPSCTSPSISHEQCLLLKWCQTCTHTPSATQAPLKDPSRDIYDTTFCSNPYTSSTKTCECEDSCKLPCISVSPFGTWNPPSHKYCPIQSQTRVIAPSQARQCLTMPCRHLRVGKIACKDVDNYNLHIVIR